MVKVLSCLQLTVGLSVTMFALLRLYDNQLQNPRAKAKFRQVQDGQPEDNTDEDNWDWSGWSDEFSVNASCLSTQLDYTPPQTDLQVYVKFVARRQSLAVHASFEQELAIPLAFVLKVDRNAEQVERELRAIYRPHNVYCIHVHRNAADIFKRAVASMVSNYDNVFVTTKSAPSNAGSFGALLADLHCMRQLVAQWRHRRWFYLINLSQGDFPLRSTVELAKIVGALNGRNLIAHWPSPASNQKHHQWKWIYNAVSGETIATPVAHSALPSALANITVCTGDATGIFSRKFVHFLVNDHWTQQLLHWLSESSSPNEYFWQTVNCNRFFEAPGGYNGALTQLKRTDSRTPIRVEWRASEPEGRLCESGFLRNTCVFTMHEMPSLLAAHNPAALFAYKFSLERDRDAFRCAELHFQHRVDQSHTANVADATDWLAKQTLLANSRRDGL